MSDIDQLIEGLHSRGLKLVKDLVANHTSSEVPMSSIFRRHLLKRSQGGLMKRRNGQLMRVNR
ncbi:hypothetical protein V1506DRAFT_548456 [Lipomyces tetrasporus]